MAQAEPIYTLGEWKGLTQYCCRHCRFDSLSEAALLAHYVDKHAPRPEPKPTGPPLVQAFDRRGRPIEPPPPPEDPEETLPDPAVETKSEDLPE